MTVKKKRSDISLIEAKDSVLFREYISFVEQTATPIVLQKVNSPNLSPSALHRKAGSAKCSILQSRLEEVG